MPIPKPNQSNGPSQRRDAHDKAVLGFAVLATIAACAAAVFTWQQANIAREQMQRALRAYVVIEAEMAPLNSEELIVITYKAENMGQTPVYNLFFMEQLVFEENGHQDRYAEMLLSFDCRRAATAFYAGGQTFGKTMSRVVRGPSVTGASPFWSVQTGKTLIARGTACYRDIFGLPHTVRICQQWLSDTDKPRGCNSRR